MPSWVGDPKCTPPPFHGPTRPPAGASRWPACKRHRLTRERRLPTRKARWQTCKRRRQPCRRRWQAWKPGLPTRKRRLQIRKTPNNGPFSKKRPFVRFLALPRPRNRKPGENPSRPAQPERLKSRAFPPTDTQPKLDARLPRRRVTANEQDARAALPEPRSAKRANCCQLNQLRLWPFLRMKNPPSRKHSS